MPRSLSHPAPRATATTSFTPHSHAQSTTARGLLTSKEKTPGVGSLQLPPKNPSFLPHSHRSCHTPSPPSSALAGASKPHPPSPLPRLCRAPQRCLRWAAGQTKLSGLRFSPHQGEGACLHPTGSQGVLPHPNMGKNGFREGTFTP